MNGVYSEFVELRKLSLTLAIDSAENFSTDAVVKRAEAYFQFLMKDRVVDQI